MDNQKQNQSNGYLLAKVRGIFVLSVLFLGATFSTVLSKNPAIEPVRGTVLGVVTDANTGEPLPGATILVRGTSLMDATDLPVGNQYVFSAYLSSTASTLLEPARAQVPVCRDSRPRAPIVKTSFLV